MKIMTTQQENYLESRLEACREKLEDKEESGKGRNGEYQAGCRGKNHTHDGNGS